MTPKERLHATVAGQKRDRVPVTPLFMSWAAHHVGHTYRDYYLDHRVLVQSHLAVARDLGVDQVSVISDPWVEASAQGMELDYPPEGVGMPKRHLLESDEDFARIHRFDPQAQPRTRNRIEAVRGLAQAVGQTHSVLGWVEGALAEYVDLRGMETAFMDLVDQPERFHRTAQILADCAIAFALEQIKAGADVIGVGDAAASQVGPELYAQHALPWEKKIIAAIHAAGAKVKLHICGNISSILELIPQTGVDMVDVDWMVPLDEARAKVGPTVTLCGNFDPTAVLLRGKPADVAAAARRCIAQAGDRFLLQPGCEVPPGTPLGNLQAFCPAAGCLIADALAK